MARLRVRCRAVSARPPLHEYLVPVLDRHTAHVLAEVEDVIGRGLTAAEVEDVLEATDGGPDVDRLRDVVSLRRSQISGAPAVDATLLPLLDAHADRVLEAVQLALRRRFTDSEIASIVLAIDAITADFQLIAEPKGNT